MRKDLPEKGNIIVEGYLMAINPLNQKTVMLKYTTVENHGRRVDGPWVFGLKNGSDCRYLYVLRRDKNTLLPIILRECEASSVIHSDEWAAYRCLKDNGYIHNTVNHQQNYVDPLTKAHTQSIERSWLDAKTKIMKTMRGTTMQLLQSHLDHYCWKVARKEEPDLFIAFLRDIKAVYR
ncbi:unnamed protein product [Macrosiphum euphorbiae]|uniref:ISXO2-like transposase domain-containing protein n=1 Tax=Macrosiphum euphorbiae TaxID=13131 RepID=A0AAV0WWJ6_9HEMI|nr:unnamed protein product [Macrosiphum euphorbiae]